MPLKIFEIELLNGRDGRVQRESNHDTRGNSVKLSASTTPVSVPEVHFYSRQSPVLAANHHPV
jgi:hypothetical protein